MSKVSDNKPPKYGIPSYINMSKVSDNKPPKYGIPSYVDMSKGSKFPSPQKMPSYVNISKVNKPQPPIPKNTMMSIQCIDGSMIQIFLHPFILCNVLTNVASTGIFSSHLNH
jgi:hypothetical protein